MEPQIIFKEVMKSDKLQSHFNINKTEAYITIGTHPC